MTPAASLTVRCWSWILATRIEGGHVNFCTRCGTGLQEEHRFCWNCGAKIGEFRSYSDRDGETAANTAPRTRHGRFGQIFGLDPRIAFLTLIVDVMLNAGEVATAGLLVPVSICAGIVLGYIVYRAQVTWYGDDRESAKIKAVILGLLTAIPTPLPELLYIPAGLIGLWHGGWRKALR